jgi:hypothetical protein
MALSYGRSKGLFSRIPSPTSLLFRPPTHNRTMVVSTTVYRLSVRFYLISRLNPSKPKRSLRVLETPSPKTGWYEWRNCCSLKCPTMFVRIRSVIFVVLRAGVPNWMNERKHKSENNNRYTISKNKRKEKKTYSTAHTYSWWTWLITYGRTGLNKGRFPAIQTRCGLSAGDIPGEVGDDPNERIHLFSNYINTSVVLE